MADYFTAAQIDAEMTSIAAGAPTLCKKTTFPNPTVSELTVGTTFSTTYSFLEIANGTGPNRVTALAVAGMHAREWAQPDAVISFAKKLIAAYKGSTAFVIPAYTEAGNTFGPVSLDKTKVKAIVDSLNVILVPLANPDGRAFSKAAPANKDWRKNRSPRTGASAAAVGVDLNRNFDIAWDPDVYYDAAFVSSGTLRSSKHPEDDTFIGTAPNSEAECKNLIWLLDNRPITFSVDLHSAMLKIMYPWGIEQNGTDPAQTFRDASFNTHRDGKPGTAYKEYFPNSPPTRLLDRHNTIAKSMSDRIFAATGRRYDYGAVVDVVYPATGSFTDFVFSRQFTIAGSPEIVSFATEFGTTADDFQPVYSAPDGYPKIEREIHAFLIAYFEAALASVPPATSGGGGGNCLFSVAVAGIVSGHAWLETLRHARAFLLATHRTRGAMLFVDRCYRRLSAFVVPQIAERQWARRLVAHGLLAPTAAIIGLVLRARSR